ncbi:hypothetical protein JOB18_022097 [Solea senegalensis]|uniref:Uncharacterized protein n=1 Tax=Solea senegalensis TaxID=28829 RepID=A0AAV6PF52_SOLSE|nr:hypothetical protein JOB18_022097 [Solea senegalensis]
MWCKMCRSHPQLADKTGVFYKGSKNFNHPLFDKHEKSKEHTNVAQAIANKHASQEEISICPLARWRDKLNEEQRQALFNIFLLAFHKAKHARPMSSYSEDVPLLKRLGVNVGDGAAVNVGVYNGVVPKLRRLAAVGDTLVHILCTAHTLENCAKAADRNVPYCETFNSSVVKLLQFYLQKGGAKKTAALKKLCEENGISFVKLDTFSTTVIPQLKAAFQVGREERNSFSYIGMQVHSLKDEIQVQQTHTNKRERDESERSAKGFKKFYRRIQQAVTEFINQWNNHGLSTQGCQTPLQLWHSGVINNIGIQPVINDILHMDTHYDISEHEPLPGLQTNNNVTIPDINITINETTMNMIRQVNPVENDGNYGIDVFSSLLHIFQ